jgi:protein-tyrosine phosphatase
MKKISVLFVCLGNICRSPMAEGIFTKIIERDGISDRFEVDSAGLISYHQGEMADSRMRHHASSRGYSLVTRSRQILKKDLETFDWILVMDDQNYEGLNRMAVSPKQFAKIHRMTDFCITKNASYVPDPYYGGDQGFENVIDLLEDACEGLLIELNKLL